MERLNISSIPVSLPIKLNVAAVSSKYFADGLFLFVYYTFKKISWMFFDFVELNLAGNFICDIFEIALAQLLDSHSTNKCCTKLILRISALYDGPIPKFNSSFSFIFHGQWIEPWRDLKIVHSWKLIAIVGANNKEIADWRMMRNLLCIYFSPVD